MYIVAKSHAAAGAPFHIIFLGKTHRTSQNTPLCSYRIKFAADCRIDRNELLHRIPKIIGPFRLYTWKVRAREITKSLPFRSINILGIEGISILSIVRN